MIQDTVLVLYSTVSPFSQPLSFPPENQSSSRFLLAYPSFHCSVAHLKNWDFQVAALPGEAQTPQPTNHMKSLKSPPITSLLFVSHMLLLLRLLHVVKVEDETHATHPFYSQSREGEERLVLSACMHAFTKIFAFLGRRVHFSILPYSTVQYSTIYLSIYLSTYCI
jgi:hypothetical protein